MTGRSFLTGTKRKRYQHSAACLSVVLCLSALAAQTPARPISFPNSGLAQAQPDFLRGIAALHSFEYEEANAAFLSAEKADPNFAMAYWGEAMTYHQSLWRNEDVAAGRRALSRLGPTPAARAAKTGSAKERAYLAAIELLFGTGEAAVRKRNYAEAMGRLHASDPADPEAAAFYALALLATMSRSLIGHDNAHEGHSSELAGSETQARVAGILQAVLRDHPNHPGALHYLIHTYDDPEHAGLGLDAARAYAKLVPSSSHAIHMPAHIFVQLGLWADAEASDRAAFAASDDWVKRRQLPAAMRSYHALSWRQYELLQMGRYREAWETLAELAPLVKAGAATSLVSELSSMRARFVVETNRWDLKANEQNFGNVNELSTIGFSAARRGDPRLAELARRALAERATSPQEGDLRPAIAIMEQEVAAVIQLKAGRRDEAIALLKAATTAELKLPLPLGLPIPIKPAPELLGEVLLESGRHEEALEAFRSALVRNANRTLSILGLARASTALGRRDSAREHYRALLDNMVGADSELPEISEARSALTTTSTPPTSAEPSSTARLLIAAVVVTVGIGGTLYFRRTTRTRRGAQAKSRSGRQRRRR